MTSKLKIAIVLLAMMTTMAQTSVQERTSDPTPVTQCNKLPLSASTAVFFSISDTAAVCREMLKVLEGVAAIAHDRRKVLLADDLKSASVKQRSSRYPGAAD